MDRRKFTLGAISLGVSGCAVGPEITKPQMSVASQFSSSQSSQSITLADAKWWTAFGDPVLNDIVELGLQQNLDIRRAVARIKQAEGLSAAAGYPISGSARVGEGKISGCSGETERVSSGFVRAEASWRLDVFRELESERNAGESNLDAAYEDADIWRLMLISEIISAYIDLRFAQELVRITKRVNETRRITLNETKKLVEAGQADEISVAQAQSILASSRASMPELQIMFVRALNRIVALLGIAELSAPHNFDRSAPQPIPRSTMVQTGVPADLIRNRPDIRRAEDRLASALATVGATEAELYPGIVLTGNIALNTASTGPSVTAGFLPWIRSANL